MAALTRPDGYYGEVAANYDASRGVKTKWLNEIAAVEQFVTDGPVLDAPLGTGRFVPIYWAKGLQFHGVDISPDMLAIARQKYPGITAELGSLLGPLPFWENQFGTVVCVRFLEWLPLEQAKRVIDELRQVAPTLILTIVHGNEGQPEAYTYDYGKFLWCLDGLFIEARKVTAQVRDMTSEIFKLRPAHWGDVIDQFRDDYGDYFAGRNIQRIADKHAEFFNLPPIPMNALTVRAEYWNGKKIGGIVHSLREHRFITDQEPRAMGGPLTVIERGDKLLMIDGRKRANRLMKEHGPHPVLVLRAA